MKVLAVLLLLSVSFSSSFAQQRYVEYESFESDEKTCPDSSVYIKAAVAEMKKKMKAGEEIEIYFNTLEDVMKKYPECNSYEKNKITSQEIASFRKYIYAYDRSFNLNEEKCTEYNVDTSNMPKNNDQTSLGWCFAFSSADLISFYEKQKVSAYDIALNNHMEREDIPEKMKSDKMDYTSIGGWPDDALEAALKSSKGICREEDFNYEYKKWADVSVMMNKIMQPGSNLVQIFCKNQFDERKIFDKFSFDALKIIDKLSPLNKGNALLDIQCKERYRTKGQYSVMRSSIHGKSKVSREKLIDEMDRVLLNGEPVTIGYSAHLLISGVNFKGQANHASTIIERKFNPSSGQCEYLIKNSWGDSNCQMARSIRCEGANYWVPRTSLKNNLEDIFYLKKTN